MICLTGDIHHMSMRGAEHAYLKGTETDAAQEYIRIAKNYGIKTTLFITGKCVEEEKQKISNLISDGNTELGGHTYSAFRPLLLYKLSSRILNRKNGPWIFQSHEIRRTINIFRNLLNYKIVSWRDHAYRHDKNTPILLKKFGIQYFSDIASPQYRGSFKRDLLYFVPINVLPDHDYIFHNGRQKGTFNENLLLLTDFKMKAMCIAEWLKNVEVQVSKIVEIGGLATLLVHPACMEISDGFKTFEDLCKFLSQYKSIYMKEVGEQYAQNFNEK